MKKIIVCVLILVIALSIIGCSRDEKAYSYSEACRMFIEGNYTEAKLQFEMLGNYNNSSEMVRKCDEKEIEKQLQGTWKVSWEELGVSNIISFDKGRYSIGMEDVEREADYWIDFDAQLIYICFDENGESKSVDDFVIDGQDVSLFISTIHGYLKQLKYTYDNGKLELFHIDSDIPITKQGSETTVE